MAHLNGGSTVAGNDIIHTGNILDNIKLIDGAGTGVDADTVDAMQPVSTNTASTIVSRDSSGNFSAGTITANLTGNSTTATRFQVARKINGMLFDGSADITITANPNAHTHVVSDITNFPAIPTKTSQLTNDGDGTNAFVTASQLGNAGYGDMLKSIYDKNNNGKVDKSEYADSAENSDTVDGKHAADFAPSGFGLGGLAKRLGSGIDANTIINNGWYDINSSTNLPSDVGTGYAKLLVICSADTNYITQIAFSMTTSTSGTIWTREKRAGTWGNWIRIANINDITFANLLNKPTTLSGYGITDGASKTDVQNSVQNVSTQPTNQIKGGVWLAPI